MHLNEDYVGPLFVLLIGVVLLCSLYAADWAIISPTEGNNLNPGHSSAAFISEVFGRLSDEGKPISSVEADRRHVLSAQKDFMAAIMDYQLKHGSNTIDWRASVQFFD